MLHLGTGGHLDARLARRIVLRRLIGFDLALAGTATLCPTVAAAPTFSNALLEITVSEPPVIDPGRQAAASPSFDNPFTQKADVKMTATVNFTAADLRAMRDGAKYRLRCEVWENDNDNQSPELGIDQFVFAFPRLVFPKSASNLPSRQEPVQFRTTVERSLLDLDTPNPNGDEIVALLLLTTPARGVIRKATNLVKLCPCQP